VLGLHSEENHPVRAQAGGYRSSSPGL
jgi:hypothetical protein